MNPILTTSNHRGLEELNNLSSLIKLIHFTKTRASFYRTLNWPNNHEGVWKLWKGENKRKPPRRWPTMGALSPSRPSSPSSYSLFQANFKARPLQLISHMNILYFSVNFTLNS